MNRRLSLLIIAAPLLAQTPKDAGLNLYSQGKEIALGRELRAELENSLAMVRTRPVETYLARLGSRLAGHAKAYPPFPYSFGVFNGPVPPSTFAFPFEPEKNGSVEALAVAGGPVFVPLRLLRSLSSEAELAAVLAHAIAHISLRHPTRLATRRQAGLLSTNPRPQQPGVEDAVRLGLVQFARRFELEADELAVRLLAEAGYDPAALVSFLRNLPGGDGSRTWSAQPSPEARLKVAEQTIQSLPRRSYTASSGQFEAIRALLARLP